MIELNKIYCENCLDTMARMPDEFVDLTVTSPPYDGLRDYNGYEFEFEKIAKELFRVTKKGGVVVWVVMDQVIDGCESLTSAKQKIFFVENCGFRVHDTMIYKRSGSGLPHENRYYNEFEYTFIFSRGKPKTVNLIKDRKNSYFNGKPKFRTVREKDGKTYPRKTIQSEYNQRGNIWEYDAGLNLSSKDLISFNHPATFPENLARDHIYSWSNEGDLVYDPFMGSGTTAKMAHLQRRNWIGSEISQEYVDLANKRLEKYLKQEVLDL